MLLWRGFSTWPGMDGGSEESEYTHYYVAEMAGDPAAPTGEIDWSATPSHLGGSDIYNGVITNWGPDWTNEAQGRRGCELCHELTIQLLRAQMVFRHLLAQLFAYSSSETL